MYWKICYCKIEERIYIHSFNIARQPNVCTHMKFKLNFHVLVAFSEYWGICKILCYKNDAKIWLKAQFKLWLSSCVCNWKKKSEVFLLFNDHPSYMPKQHLTTLAKHLLKYKLTEKRKGEDAKIICIMVFYNVMVHVQLILRHL